MASLLRSGKFLRLFSSNIGRNFDVTNGTRLNPDTSLCARRSEWDFKLHKSLSTVQVPVKSINEGGPPPVPPSGEKNVERALVKADLDIQKIGRISRSDIESIVEEIKIQKTVSSSQSLLLIRCCGNLVPEEPPAARTQLVHEIWKMLESFGVKLDVSHYNSLLRVYVENEHRFNPMDFLKKLAEKGVEPNRVTYQRLLTSYCQRGDINGASQILELMKSKDLPISEVVFNSLIMGHSNTGDMESARGVIKVMSQAGLEPDGETYRALLSGYAKQGLLNELTDTLGECEVKEVSLHHRDFLEVIYSAAIHGRVEIVDYLMDRMSKSTGYNQDCVNVILRLVNQKQEDMGFKLLLSMKPGLLMDGATASTGNFFIRQIVKSNISFEKIVDFCQRLIDSGLNNRALFRALEVSNSFGKRELSSVLLKRIKNQKETLRPSMFWPLLTSQSKISGETGVLDVLRQMSSVRLYPNLSTMNSHVLPHFADLENSEGVLKKLKSADVPLRIGITSLLLQHLKKADFKSAIQLLKDANQMGAGFEMDEKLFGGAICEAYLKTMDSASVIKLIQMKIGSSSAEPLDEAELKTRSAELAGPVVNEILEMAPRPKLVALEPILEALKAAGISLPQSVTQVLHEKIGDDMTDSVAALLTELESGKLTPSSIEFTGSTSPAASSSLDSGRKSLSLADRLIFRFINLVRDRRMDDALALKQEIDAKGIPHSDAMDVMLMELYSFTGKLDDAMTLLDEMLIKWPDMTISPYKLLNLVFNLVKDGRNEDVLKVLKHLKPSEAADGNNSGLNLCAWRAVNAAAEKGDAVLAQQIVDAVEASKIMTKMNPLLGPLVNVHLAKDNVQGALDEFTRLSEKYSATPMKSALIVKLIETENAAGLQQVMNASFKVHGEMNSLYDLIFNFIECGRIRQAKKVLETPGLRPSVGHLENVCKRYIEGNKVEELENLVKITRDAFGVDRKMMYNCLLTACIKTEDADRASSLWTMMQEEDVTPSDNFLRKLGKLLTDKGHNVPFSIPDGEILDVEESPAVRVVRRTPKVKAVAVTEQSPIKTTTKKTPQSEFMDAIKNKDGNAALEIKHKYPDVAANLSVNQQSNLIEALHASGRTESAHEVMMDMLKADKNPLQRFLRLHVNRLTAAGAKDSLTEMKQYLNEESQKGVSLDSKILIITSGDPASASTFLDSVLESSETRIPLVGFLTMMEKNPDLLPKCQQVAQVAFKNGDLGPTNAIWCHYLLTGRMEEADSLWDSLKASTKIFFAPVARFAKEKGDEVLAEKLVKCLTSVTSEGITSTAVGLAYSSLIDIRCEKNNLDGAVEAVNQAVQGGVKLEDIKYSSLRSLESSFKEAGRPFPFVIPKLKARSLRTEE